MKNTTINYIKILFELHFEEICENKNKFKEDYIKKILGAYKEFLNLYGEEIDGIVFEHYKGRIGIKDE